MDNEKYMKAPFPYFGGKSMIADIVWQYLGDVKHYIEPFFGSGAVLLKRPNYDPLKHIETINDKDGFIANVWRSLKFSPEQTAEWADWPVNHADLSARKKKLIEREGYLLGNLVKDDEWHDPKLAGYWIWAASCWIGSGLTSIGQRPDLASRKGVLSKRPHLAGSGQGVHSIGQIPFLASDGRGVNVKTKNIYDWFAALSYRLRRVRVVCGDWSRVCGGNWQDNEGVCGMFFDPPYSVKHRDKNLYHHDSLDVAHEVRLWCIERGKLKTYRIVLAGYEGEHNELENHGWKKISWKTGGGYANARFKKDSKSPGKENAKMERLWISPHCVKNDLFDDL